MFRIFAAEFSERSDETAANIAITMLYQYDVLITRLIESQKRRFLEEGGIKEQMFRARMQARGGYPNYNQGGNQGTRSSQNPVTVDIFYLPLI